MNRIGIIQKILTAIDGKNYLEIGVNFGASFIPIKAETKIGVDPDFKFLPVLKALSYFKTKNAWFYNGTSDDFFERSKGKNLKFDVIFIDGLHTYEQSLKDVYNSLPFLSDKGVIILHDCNPTSHAMAYPAESFSAVKKLKLEGATREWCGDVWKTIIDVRSDEGLNAVVINCDYGVGIVTRRTQKAPRRYPEASASRMTYADLEKDRIRLLNLREPEYLDELVKQL